MSILTAICALAFYAGAAILAAGLVCKAVQYARTPAPLKIPTTPAPTTRVGVAARIAREVVLFESLFKASKWTWLFGWIFHAALLVVLIGHLRYFTEPVWAPAGIVQGVAPYAGVAMIAGLAGLWARRFLVDRVRYISAPSDHLMLALLVAIGGSGVAMRFAVHTDIVALKAFVLGLMYFDWQPIPPDAVLLAACRIRHRADGGVPVQQAAPRPRPVLQPHPQPGRQLARTPPCHAVGGAQHRSAMTCEPVLPGDPLAGFVGDRGRTILTDNKFATARKTLFLYRP